MKKAIVITGICLLLAGGAFAYYKRQIDYLQDMDFDIEKFKVVSLGVDQTIVQFKLKLTSKSTLQAPIKKLDIDIYVGDILLGNAVSMAPFIIPAKGYSEVDMEMKVSPKAIIDNVFDLTVMTIKNRDAQVLIKGRAKVKVALANINVPVNYKTTVGNLLS